MDPFHSIKRASANFKLVCIAGLLAAVAAWGFGLDSLFQDEAEKISILADAEGFDAEEKVSEFRSKTLDIGSFGYFTLATKTHFFRAGSSLEKASVSSFHPPGIPKYLLYHNLKFDC
jgi:hypothetical protein